MRWYRWLVVLVGVVALTAGTTAMVAGAASADAAHAASGAERPGDSCAVFPDGFEAGAQRPVCGGFLTCYRANGGPAGPFGRPVDEERPNAFAYARLGDRVQGFRGGDMFLTSSTGDIVVGGWFAYTPLHAARRTLPSCPPPAGS